MKTISTVMNVDMDKELNINGKIYRLVEEQKPALKAGEWWYHSTGVLNLIVEVAADHGGTVKCVPTHGIPNDKGFSFHGISAMTKKADIEEVKKILISEAGKYTGKLVYCKEFEDTRRIDSVIVNNYGVIGVSDVIDGELHSVLFRTHSDADAELYKWAEIIEEKKPLYINSYGTAFFKGDYPWEVVKDGLLIHKIDRAIDILIDLDITLKEDKDCSVIIPERECHRYLDENWDELNK